MADDKAAPAKKAPTKKAAVNKDSAKPSNRPVAMVTLLLCPQLDDPETGVTLVRDVAVPVKKVTDWMKRQEGYGQLSIEEL